MGHEFTVFKGSSTGDFVEGKGRREIRPTEAFVEITHCGVCGTDEHYRHVDMGLGHEESVSLGAWISCFHGFGPQGRRSSGNGMDAEGLDMYCLNSEQFGSANHDQGCFSTGLAWDLSSLHRIPDEIASEDAGPLMCGGATVWAPLYQNGIKAGDRVGVVGIGGLGHLAIQYASKMGLEVVVFSSTESKKEEAMQFGATEFVVTKGLEKFEGIEPIDFLLITTSMQPNFALYQTVMAKGGKIFPLTISFGAEPLPMLPMVTGGLSVIGSAGAHRQSIDAMLKFTAKHGIKPKIQKFPMSEKGLTEAMQVLRDGKMRYRGVAVV